MDKDFNGGERVLVDWCVFLASPQRTDRFALCDVLLPARAGDQVYVCRVDGGTPLYVFPKHIRSLP